jgi:hypothetical protein
LGWDGASLLPSLVLYQQRRDTALRLPRPSRQTRTLLAFYLGRQRATLATIGRAAFLRGVIQACQAEVHRLIEAADTPDKRRAALDKVTDLNELAERAAAALEIINV